MKEAMDIATPDMTGSSLLGTAEGLNLLRIGLFRLDRDGYLLDFNDTGAGILGVDQGTSWNDRHISAIDRFLGLGLAEQFETIIQGKARFAKRHMKCTNRHGRYMELSLSCTTYPNQEGEPEVYGLVQDSVEDGHSSSDTTKHRQGLYILADVASALSSSAELGQILRTILTGATASQGLGFNRAFLFLYDQETDSLIGHLAVGPSSPEEAGHIWGQLDTEAMSLTQLLDPHETPDFEASLLSDRIAGVVYDLKQDSMITHVCQTGDWVNLTDTDPIDANTSSFLDCLGTKNAALVPLVSKGNLRGLLAADNFITGQPIADDAVGLLQILADQAAVAIQRARLLDLERKRVDELQQINRQLAESQEQAIQFGKMSVMGELTAAIAHSLQNPLDIMAGFVSLTLQAQPTSEQQEYLNIVSTEIKRIESVLHQVLRFSQASSNDLETIEFSRLIDDDFDRLQGIMHRSKISISRALAQAPLIVRGNREQLRHAIGQLLGLIAEDIMPSGRLVLRTERVGGMARLLVIMECPGDHVRRIERSLKQMFADQSQTQYLPLLVTNETFKFHGGRLDLASGSDGGPCLFVELPLLEDH
ncbi:MAG: GAF domain-containing sensor histidine kinase [candidate division Zixibacteria bacterium]|nr:GAF domain-containing sensor histidine kinase [candidate division Zixibacteria bacterium]